MGGQFLEPSHLAQMALGSSLGPKKSRILSSVTWAILVIASLVKKA